MVIDYPNLIKQLNHYQQEAKAFGCEQADCGFLATVSDSGQPSVRIITIYQITEQGLLFLANKNSGKIRHLQLNPKAGLCFYWDEIHLQITVEGIVEPLDHTTTCELWNRRDHQANLTAWAIDIAKDNKANDNLVENKQLIRQRTQATRLPLAESWWGYGLKPKRIDLWNSQWHKNKQHQAYSYRGGCWQQTTYHY